jgi:hypothetical protein
MKNLSLLLLFMISTTLTFSQLKVDQNGRVGIGTLTPHPDFKLHVVGRGHVKGNFYIGGNLLISSFPSDTLYECNIRVNNGWPGVEMGSNHDKIAFWSSETSYNDLYAANFYKMSDRKLKSDLKEIDFGLSRLMKIRPLQYSIVDNKINDKGEIINGFVKQFGFISQEIEELFPEVKLTDDAYDIKLLDYDQIIPIAVAAIKEQQFIIDSLKSDIELIKEQLELYSKNNSNESRNYNGLQNNNTLLQNNPNPFREKTVISFSIEKQNFKNASIVIFDMNGTLIKKIDIFSADENAIVINANELKAGMYIYSLIVNQREIDSKRMILLN